MRILTVCAKLKRGGTERVAQNFSLALNRLGHQVAVLAYQQGGPRRRVIEEAGVPVHVGADRLTQALEAADRFNPELIHIHRTGSVNAVETELLRRLKVADRRVLETNVFGRVDYSKGADLIDVHLQLTEWCMWRWRKWLGQKADQVPGVILPNAVETGDFERCPPDDIEAFRQRVGIPPQAFLYGSVAQGFDRKWPPQLFQAFAEVAHEDPGAHMVCMGLPQTRQPLLDSLPPNVRSRIKTLPQTDSDQELSAFYSSLDCFLHCSTFGETFGMVLTEAMLCGCPCVTASLPHKGNSQVEVVGHMKGGVVAGSMSSFQQAVRLPWSDRDLRDRLAGTGREHVVGRFEANILAERLVQLGAVALEHGDRASLARRLNDGVDYQSHVAEVRILELMRNTLGGPATVDLVKMRLGLNPTIQRGVSRYLRWRHTTRKSPNADRGKHG